MPTFIENIPQGLRFVVAGGFATAVSWLVRFPLSLFLPFAAAVAVAQMIGMVVGFFSYQRFVYAGSDRHVAHQVRDFIIVNLVTSVIVTAVAVVLAKHTLPWLGLTWQTEAIAYALGIATGAVCNYFGHKSFSFRQA